MSQMHMAESERERMIAEAAYFRAERRGFAGGDPLIDWLEAEAEVTARLAVPGQVAGGKPRRSAGTRKTGSRPAEAPKPRKR